MRLKDQFCVIVRYRQFSIFKTAATSVRLIRDAGNPSIGNDVKSCDKLLVAIITVDCFWNDTKRRIITAVTPYRLQK